MLWACAMLCYLVTTVLICQSWECFSAPMIHQFEVYVDDTPHISAMSSNVITFECLRRLRGFRQSLKLAAGVWMFLLLVSDHLGWEVRDLRACQFEQLQWYALLPPPPLWPLLWKEWFLAEIQSWTEWNVCFLEYGEVVASAVEGAESRCGGLSWVLGTLQRRSRRPR